MWAASAAPAGSATDAATTRLPDVTDQTADHQPGTFWSLMFVHVDVLLTVNDLKGPSTGSLSVCLHVCDKCPSSLAADRERTEFE